MDGLVCLIKPDPQPPPSEDRTALAGYFVAGNLFCMYVPQAAHGQWYASFEAEKDYPEPEHAIGAMLAVVEYLAGPLRSVWDGCTLREFNIGYDCGADPWAYNQGLSAKLLGRMAAVGASLRFTLYPDQKEVAPPPVN